ncbi:MAG: hypothetical protein ABIQ96_08955 [Luteolibacter sp.]
MKPTKFISSIAVVALVAGNLFAQGGPPPLAPLPKIPKQVAEPAHTASPMAPPDVVASAVDAVAKLGEEVVLGRYQVAVERMNPVWKERTAKRLASRSEPDGMKALEKQLAGVAQQMVQQGISMISFKPQGQPRSYEVGAGKKVEKVNGQDVETLVFNQWMVLIPTATKFRITRQNEKTLVIESIGFQVAVSDKGKNNWTFIDGSGISVNDLRGLFFNLPQDMQLPPVEKHESR